MSAAVRAGRYVQVSVSFVLECCCCGHSVDPVSAGPSHGEMPPDHVVLTGLGVGGTFQKAGHGCRRPTLARAMSAEALVDAASSAQSVHFESIQQIISMPFGELSEGLETPVQLIYLVTLLGFLVVGAYLVVRQVSLLQQQQVPEVHAAFTVSSFACLEAWQE